MNRSTLVAIVVTVLLSTAFLWQTTPLAPVNAQPAAGRIQWEYRLEKITMTEKEFGPALNKLGEAGWEYADGYPSNEAILFKRPKR